ncbi:hypothetical protein VOLCADRAFT_96524 [Volvox carteri f. nagariensis]|uniref:F-box domain-containing protein n=1 Tax=Volvox carteri f. nagariensis TaxID=3068 RepID=D8UAC0_VOLCA|nr:uncharacterized protein VOLCADRAFT_96524 [Volvox carteri f. nagariensis]EFJ43242.1 hypothetical protein VOLCADRAFT_96524 [Volvox carteri f. nagariensis]|eukprot:XP_002955602.1 hypothetical protein VOLCADRAFT_96524 [Volvox carteri f. nagariensis]
MSSARPLWADGDPEELALAFFARTEETGKRLGRRHYMRFLAAISSASVHNAWMQATSPGGDLVAQLSNILQTAQAAERLITSALPPELDDDDDGNESDEGSSTSSSTSKMADAPSEGTAGAQSADDEPPLSGLKAAVNVLLGAAGRAAGRAAAAAADNSGASCVGDGGGGDGGGPAVRSRDSPNRAPAELPASPRRVSSCAHGPHSRLLLLTNELLDSILTFLDGCSAASAAAACRRLRAAHNRLHYFDLSPAFRTYLAALIALREENDFLDGSLESEFVANFPLDGSPVCGVDLSDDAFRRRMTAAMPDVEQVFALLAAPGDRSLEEFRSSIAHAGQQRPQPPHVQSSPLAAFSNSKPPGPTSIAAAAGGGSGGGSHGGSGAGGTGLASWLVNAMCDVHEISNMPAGRMCCDGDLLVLASGYDSGGGRNCARMPPPLSSPPAAAALGARSPPSSGVVVTALTLGRGPYVQYDGVAQYNVSAGRSFSSSGPPYAVQLCADSTNGLVWVASNEGGGVIRGFRAPAESPSSSLPLASGGRRRDGGGRGGGDTALQYVLYGNVSGLGGSPAGVHVVGERLAFVTSSGAVQFWNLASTLRPGGQMASWAPGSRGGGAVAAAEDYAAGRGDDADTDMYDNDDDILFGEGDEDDEDFRKGRPPHRWCRRSGYAATVVHNVRPHVISTLPLPSPRGDPSPLSLLTSLSADTEPMAAAHDGDGDGGPICLTRLLYDGTAPTAPILVAALTGNIVVSYDLETLRVKQQLLGHLYGITDIAVPPSAWRQSDLFATCARSGDVKLWDVRTKCGSAAVTLTNGETAPLNSVVLASASGGSGGGDGGGRGQLGGGMICFAGDPLQLSTGNTQVISLAWHGSRNSLLAACESKWESVHGTHSPQDWKLVRVDGGLGVGGGGGGGSFGMVGGCGAVGGDALNLLAAGGTAATTAAAAAAAAASTDRQYYWPARAKHLHGDFGAYFNLARSCVLRYRFSEHAGRCVPASSSPRFEAGWATSSG